MTGTEVNWLHAELFELINEIPSSKIDMPYKPQKAGSIEVFHEVVNDNLPSALLSVAK
jgi:hypothetical protein